jgi:hypothetical protein
VHRPRAAGLLAIVAAVAIGHAFASARAHPPPILSPLPGTPDASPATQLSVLGVPAREIAAVRLVGTRSGVHAGVLRAYASAPGASFLPAHPFIAGEHVQAVVRLHDGETARTSFGIGRYVAPTPLVPGRAERLVGPQVKVLRSRPDLRPPRLDVRLDSAAAAPGGDLFLAPLGGIGLGPQTGQSGTMILDPHGRLVWFRPLPPGQIAMDFRPVPGGLGWFQGDFTLAGYGIGEEVLTDDHYRIRRVVHAGNGLQMDLHEYLPVGSGSAYITAYVPVAADLRPYGGPRHGSVLDCIVQRIDLRTGLVMWEWHALAVQRPSESHEQLFFTTFDPFHVNSLALDGDSLIVSERNTWAVLAVSLTDGRIEWQLGGRRSTLTLGPGAQFAWQHSVRVLPDNELAIFDNEGTGAAPYSRALVLGLDQADHRAVLVKSLSHPDPPLWAINQGDVQALPGGQLFVGWGAKPWVSQFSASGQLLFDAELPAADESYRAFRAPWVGHPAGPPALVAVRHAGGGATVYASWNGATAVVRWRVLAGGRALASVPFAGFETAIRLRRAPPTVRVQALGASGRVLATSAAVAA